MTEARLWIFENIGRDLPTQAALALAFLSGGKVGFGGGRDGMLRFWRRVYSIERFDEFASRSAIDADSHWRIYRVTEARAAAVESAAVFRALAGFFPHPKLGPALRKELITDGFKELVIRRDVERLRAEGRRPLFLAARHRPHLAALFPESDLSAPALWRWTLRLNAALQRITLPVFFGLRGLAKFLKNGLVWRLPPPRDWGVASIILGEVSTGGLAFDGITYGDGALAPENILHILKYRPLPAYRDYARERNLTTVFPGDLPGTPRFLLGRLLGGFVVRIAGTALLRGGTRDLVEAVLRVALHILETELLMLHHRPRLCFGFDCYWTMADARAMVLETRGGRYIGYMFAMPWLPLYMYQNSVMPVFLCPGEGLREMFGETLRHVERVIPAGLLLSERSIRPSDAARALRAQAPTPYVVAAYDSTYAPFWGLTREVFLEFFGGLLELAAAFPDTTLFIKTKYDLEKNIGADFSRLTERLRAHPRVRIFKEESAYDVLAAADSVIAITSSTTGWEGLVCRKPALFFDPRPDFQINPALKYSPGWVCHRTQDLLERFGELRCGRYVDQATWARAVGREARFAEERPLEAFRAFLLKEHAGMVAAGQVQTAKSG